ncbi:histidine kinase [Paenibacillus aurantius]|uniref:Histidine kinase n=1 Tax=Paenibacillus aurantius TaxID=2918900 RepID=A0AA96LIP7_9BACL|nr:histidine kinase [Paenibacillus aurantius]WNQ13995.1 histidine kinase [Paenibacillus aurantius]
MTFKLFLICFIFVFATVSLVSQLAYRYIQNETRSNNQYFVQQILSKVDQYLTVTFSSFQTILFSIDSAYTPGQDTIESLKTEMQKLLELNSATLKNVYIIREDMSIVGGSLITVAFDEPNEERRPLYDQAMNSKLSTAISRPYRSSSSGWTVTMTKYLHGSNPPAAIAVDLDLNAVEQTILKIMRDDLITLTLIDPEGFVVAGQNSELGMKPDPDHRMVFGSMSSREVAQINENTIHLTSDTGKPFTLLKLPTSRFNWSIISVNNEARIQQSLQKLEHYYLLLLGIGLLISGIVASIIARYIRKPLQYLINKMKLIRQGHLDVKVQWKRRDEFGLLAHTFDLMIKQIVGLLDHLNVSNESKRKLEIQVLQSQINPHFLYNTLGSVCNVVGLQQYDKVDPMIRALINILEYGIADASEWVTLDEELQNVRDYVLIQNIRYNRIFDVQVEVEEGLRAFPVFRLLLQPIVENSLFHGYRGGRVEGPITIKAYLQDNRVVVEVRDEGEGMSPETADNLLQAEKPGRPNERGRVRIGLRNIHQRIRLYYGEAYGLTILSEPGRGTCIRAVFPKGERGEA